MESNTPTDSSTLRPRPRSSSPTGRILQTTLSVAIVLATLFTGLPSRLFQSDLTGKFRLLLTPESPSNPAVIATSERTVRIGIVAGHWGNDSGSVCQNGTTEQEVNFTIADLVQQKLKALGFQVDLLQEFDSRLEGYKAAALISIHNDSCEYVNEEATGFKVATSPYSHDKNLAGRLEACLQDRFAMMTSQPYHAGSVTLDMQDYYAFRETNTATTAAIIETGFLNKDFAILTQHPDRIAEGVVAGILCFVNNENVASTPIPTSSP